MTNTHASRFFTRLVLEQLEDRSVPNASYHPLAAGDFFQDWSDTGRITADHNWDAVPSVIGYRGDGLTGSVGIDPRTVTAFAGAGGPVVHVLANRTDPDSLTTGGVAEFHLADPAVALQGSATARAPFLLFHLDTTAMTGVWLYLELRDLDGSDDDAQSQVAIQYRVGETGEFRNLPDGYVEDVSVPGQAGLVTPMFVILPPDAENQPRVQLRVLTTDAAGSDEWVGIDTFYVSGTPGKTTSEHLRVAVYNVTSTGGTPRAGLGEILQAIGEETVGGRARPMDVLALQEVQRQATTTQAVVNILNGIYGPGVYARGTMDGATTGGGTQGLVYNTQTLQLLGEARIGTASTSGQPRQALRYHLRPVGTDGSADFFVYNSHFKAINDAPSRNRRLVEAQALRADADALGPGANVFFVGDFNMYTSNEPAYQHLLGGGDGQAFDPINRPGNWHAGSSFRDVFTQAPAINPPLGLTGGGIDDRFDFQLITDELLDSWGLDYRSGTYHTFGVNGSLPVNAAVNDPRNTALLDLPNRLEILEMLTQVSDHLPVIADYVISFGGNRPGPNFSGWRPDLVLIQGLSAAVVPLRVMGGRARAVRWSRGARVADHPLTHGGSVCQTQIVVRIHAAKIGSSDYQTVTVNGP